MQLFQQNPKKSLVQKLTPKKSHAKFSEGLNDIKQKETKTLEIECLCLFIFIILAN